MRETPLAKHYVVHSLVLNTKIEKLCVARPWTKIPQCLLGLTKNHGVRGIAAPVLVSRFRYSRVAMMTVVADELAGFLHAAKPGDHQHGVFRRKSNPSTAAHHGCAQLCAVSWRYVFREQFGFPSRIGDRKKGEVIRFLRIGC